MPRHTWYPPYRLVMICIALMILIPLLLWGNSVPVVEPAAPEQTQTPFPAQLTARPTNGWTEFDISVTVTENLTGTIYVVLEVYKGGSLANRQAFSEQLSQGPNSFVRSLLPMNCEDRVEFDAYLSLSNGRGQIYRSAQTLRCQPQGFLPLIVRAEVPPPTQTPAVTPTATATPTPTSTATVFHILSEPTEIAYQPDNGALIQGFFALASTGLGDDVYGEDLRVVASNRSMVNQITNITGTLLLKLWLQYPSGGVQLYEHDSYHPYGWEAFVTDVVSTPTEDIPIRYASQIESEFGERLRAGEIVWVYVPIIHVYRRDVVEVNQSASCQGFTSSLYADSPGTTILTTEVRAEENAVYLGTAYSMLQVDVAQEDSGKATANRRIWNYRPLILQATWMSFITRNGVPRGFPIEGIHLDNCSEPRGKTILRLKLPREVAAQYKY